MELFAVNNNYLPVKKLFTVNNDLLLIKIVTVNNE